MGKLVAEAGLTDAVTVDSAGTARYHVGDGPDPRTVAEASRRGIPIAHRARQLSRAELHDWDLVLVMDEDNLRDVRRLAGGGADLSHVRLLRSFERVYEKGDSLHGVMGPDLEVPDPYYGDDAGFSTMFDLLEPACRGVLDHLVQQVLSEERTG